MHDLASTVPEADLYHAVAWQQRGLMDVSLWHAISLDVGEPVLELGSGTARVLAALVVGGTDAWGIEIDPDRRAAGLDRLVRIAGESARPRMLSGDMRLYRDPGRFGLVLAPYNVFALLDDDALAETLASTAVNLRPGGELAFESQIWPSPDDPCTCWTFGPTPLWVNGHKLSYHEEVERVGSEHLRVERTFEFSDGSTRPATTTLQVRSVSRLVALLEAAGWRTVGPTFDEHGSSPSSNSWLAFIRATPR